MHHWRPLEKPCPMPESSYQRNACEVGGAGCGLSEGYGVGTIITWGGRPHLFRPRRFSEKIQWRKLFDLDPIYAVFSDKVATREYVAQRVGSDAVVPMLWLGNDPAALPLDTLRAPYIIKCSHGSGWNVVVRDNDPMNYDTTRVQLGRWLASDFGYQKIEPGYSAVPHLRQTRPILSSSPAGRRSPNLEIR